ncbi:response regulator [Methylobacterium iners]|uniref:Sensor histidine kinase RcsC n=1 Tax=Methylobacterium iners TaxID=418707 RepID=A0ABQ4RS16_9HYPH|nr:response regulator [Methylobacterium iners]GJD92977.1 Sensor histidine kinase RcsC [Methylobacterium iners]
MTANPHQQSAAVLIVEDDLLVRMISSDILTDAGFRAFEAHDAQEAMTLLEVRTDVRVVFTDRNMPGEMDGIGLARLVRKRWPEVGIIVTSGKMQPAPGDLPEGVKFLLKPYRPSTLIEEVEALVSAGGDVEQGASVLPEGMVMQSPVMAEVGGQGIAAAVAEADKS